MNVKELKVLLEGKPDNMDVFIHQTNDEFNCSLLENANVKNMKFVDGKLVGYDDCLILTDDI